MSVVSSAPTSDAEPRILIVGAGITGLLLAQALRKRGSSPLSPPTPKFSIFERDPTPSFRGAGWGLTIHWSLKDFLSLLPQYLVDRLPETFVNPEAVEQGDKGNFLLYDLQTGAEKYRVPPNERIRVSRERLRTLLMDGLDIQWSKNVVDVEPDSKSVTIRFEDGTSACGTHVVGADGSRSQVRKRICPLGYENYRLPIRLLGASVPYTKKECENILALDPFFLQGSHPVTDAYLWFSFLEVPRSTTDRNGKDAKSNYICQIILSWPYREGYWNKSTPIETPKTNVERIRWMKEMTDGWVEPFKGIVQNIPEEIEAKSISLEDWLPEKGSWNNLGGRVTLVGDAAHAMTMFRGEAANHGIADVASLCRELFDPNDQEENSIDRYEGEMIPRARVAVLNSRKACMDAHDAKSITESSPLVARRVMVLSE